MSGKSGFRRLCVVAALSGLGAAPALADAIDGDWCNGISSLQINGPAIRTPGGKDITGTYSRHAFRYIAPAGDRDAGAEVLMRLLGEQEMLLMRRIGGTESPAESWKRCQPVS